MCIAMAYRAAAQQQQQLLLCCCRGGVQAGWTCSSTKRAAQAFNAAKTIPSPTVLAQCYTDGAVLNAAVASCMHCSWQYVNHMSSNHPPVCTTTASVIPGHCSHLSDAAGHQARPFQHCAITSALVCIATVVFCDVCCLLTHLSHLSTCPPVMSC
jgi:hypothetical protein